MNRFASITVVLVLALALAYVAWAQGPAPTPPPQGPPPGMGMPGMGGPGGFRPMQPCAANALNLPQPMLFGMAADRLKLSNEQVDKLKTMVITAEQALRPLRDKSREAPDALRAGVFDPGKDAQALRELADKAEKAEATVISAQLDAWAKLKAELKAEQLNTLQEMMGRGRGPMPMMPPPNGPPPIAPPPVGK